MQSASLAHNGNYSLLPHFTPNNFVSGYDTWTGSFPSPACGNPKGALPAVTVNTTAATIMPCTSTFTIPPDTVSVHPAPTQMAIVGWRSPIGGVVSVAGGVSDNDPGCGDGIGWYVDAGTHTVASGSIPNGGSATFPAGLSVTVKVGDFLYFLVDPGASGNYFCDSTRLDVTISATGTGPGNPSGFDPTGKYNLFISCASPCDALYQTDPGVPRSGFAFGEMGIAAFDPSTGTLGGPAKLFATFTDEPKGFLSNQVFGISGKIASGRVDLDFQALIPAAGLSGFSLAGGVTYGGASASGGYQPLFGGSIDSTKNDGWLACFEQAQRDCVQPSTSNNKATAAKSLGAACLAGTVASAAGVVTVELSPVFAVCGAIMTVIGLFDPPDPHYKHVTRPPRISGIRVPARHGLSGRAAAAATQVITVLDQTAATGLAFLDAYQRFQGAARATDPKWLGPQYLATLKYGHALAAQARQAAAVIAAERSILASSLLGSSRISPQTLERLVRSARSHGWPSRVVKQLAQWGISASTLRATLKLIPTTAPADARTPLGPILDPTFTAHLRAYADGLDRYLTAFAKRPLR